MNSGLKGINAVNKNRTFSWVLTFILLVTMVFNINPVTVKASGSTTCDTFIKIVFVDCGRKYFSVSSLENIIDNAASGGFTHVMLGLGNDGLRFLLDDMSLTVNGTTYSSEKVMEGIHRGNEAYYNFATDELSESEMDTIIEYAESRGISIIPMINSPGHMDAIIDCMEYCGLENVAYNNSSRTVDVTNTQAVAFTQALIKKYVNYFSEKGCTYFNIGADEYANDVYTSGSMGFGNLISTKKYGSFVTYVNNMSSIIKEAGMNPMAFNDGIYFNNATSYGTFDNDIIILYWSSGWNGYTPMSAANLENNYGFKLINTHGDYYWVLGKSSWQCSESKASGFNVNSFQGSTITDPYGACFCIWCDYPGADTDSNVVSSTASVISAFGEALPEAKSVKEVSGSRTEVNFNQDWKFYLGNPASAYEKNFDDASWEDVTLPHDFSISQSYTTSGEAESGFLPGGTGWYRKTFTVGDDDLGKTTILSFDGVYSDAYVYCNGTFIGEHHYGYTSFAFDLSDYIVSGDNVIAIKAVNDIPTSRWYSGSGIYRDVTLITENPVHAALNGTSVTTPDISSGKGTVKIETEIQNDGNLNKTVTVTENIYIKGSDEPLASGSTTVTVNAGRETTASVSATVDSPQLWSLDSPNLYTAETVLTVNGEEVDRTTDDFGFRWTEFDDTNGFYLNGEAVKLKGVCLHHDQGGLGSAAYTDSIRRQLEIMKDMGVNAIRTTHNPADEDLIDLCNEMGLMVIEEAFDGWSQAKNGNTNDFSKYFNSEISSTDNLVGAESGETWAQFAIQSMVKRDRNDPSVILWSIGNEITEGTTTDCSEYPTIAENLISWVQAEDKSRPVTIGDNQRVSDKTSTIGLILNAVQDAGGVVGFNYASDSQLYSLNDYWGPIISSETSSATNSRGIYKSQANNTDVDGKYHLTSYDTSAVNWGKTAHDSIYDTMTRDYVSGEFVWTGFDYLGEPTPYNGTARGSVIGAAAYPNSSYFGIVDTAGFKKDTYYLYRSQWNNSSDTLHLVTAWDNDNQLISGGKTPVVIYSNAAKVELYRNGSLIGTATRTVHTTAAGHEYYTYNVDSNNSSVCTAVSSTGSEALYATFNVTYESGTISAKAYDENNKEITDSCEGNTSVSTPGTPSVVNVSADTRTVKAGDLIFYTVEITDNDGNPDTTAATTLNFTLSGNGKILAVDNGDQATIRKGQQSSVLTGDTSANIEAFAGKALVIVQAEEGEGSVTLTATAGSSGYEAGSATVSINNGIDKVVEIDCNKNVDGKTVFIALYDENDRMLVADVAEVSDGMASMTTKTSVYEGVAYAKMFVVDNNSYAPTGKSVKVSLQQT